MNLDKNSINDLNRAADNYYSEKCERKLKIISAILFIFVISLVFVIVYFELLG